MLGRVEHHELRGIELGFVPQCAELLESLAVPVNSIPLCLFRLEGGTLVADLLPLLRDAFGKESLSRGSFSMVGANVVKLFLNLIEFRPVRSGRIGFFQQARSSRFGECQIVSASFWASIRNLLFVSESPRRSVQKRARRPARRRRPSADVVWPIWMRAPRAEVGRALIGSFFR